MMMQIRTFVKYYDSRRLRILPRIASAEFTGSLDFFVSVRVKLFSATLGAPGDMADLADIRVRPKAELHVHLEGSIDLSTLNSIARRKGLADGERRFGTTVNLIFSIPRTFDEEAGVRTLELIESFGGPRVVGIDLSGMESGRDIKRFAEIFRDARRMGLATVAHAGEFTSSRRIHETIDLLGVQRIGHGISAWNDETLIQRLVREGIALEVAVTSNVRLDAVPSLADHPVRRLYDAGIPIVINTDDPGLFSTTLNQEYALLAEEFGFTARDLHHLIDNSFTYAFLDDSIRARLPGGMGRP